VTHPSKSADLPGTPAIKTDKADARKIARYGLEYWNDLRRYAPTEALRAWLKQFSRQLTLYTQMRTQAKKQPRRHFGSGVSGREPSTAPHALTATKNGWISSRLFGIANVFAALAKQRSHNAMKSGARAWAITFARQMPKKSTKQAKTSPFCCRKTLARSCL
jgi:transposase